MSAKYKSKYCADREIGAPQFLAEFICERLAQKEKLTLPPKFWNTERWKKEFLKAVVQANRLLKDYFILEIMDALRHPKGKNIYSLGCRKQIENIIKQNKSKQFKPTFIQQDNNDEDIFTSEEFDVAFENKGIPPKAKNLWEELN